MSSSIATLRARAAAYERWAAADGVRGTAAARKAGPGSLEYWLSRQPEHLSPVERQRRAERAKKAYFLRLSLKSAEARAARKRKKA